MAARKRAAAWPTLFMTVRRSPTHPSPIIWGRVREGGETGGRPGDWLRRRRGTVPVRDSPRRCLSRCSSDGDRRQKVGRQSPPVRRHTHSILRFTLHERRFTRKRRRSAIAAEALMNEAPRSSLLRRSSHFGYEGRKLRDILRNSPKPLPSFAKATKGSPRLHPRSKLRGIR